MVRKTNGNAGARNAKGRTPTLTKQVEEIRGETARASDRMDAYDGVLTGLRKDWTVLGDAVADITRYLARPWYQRAFGRLQSESPVREDGAQPEVEIQSANVGTETEAQSPVLLRKNRLWGRPSRKMVGLTALALGAAGVLGLGGCQIRNLIRDWPETVYEGALKDGEFRYLEGNKANTLEVQSGNYKFVFTDDDNRTSIKDGDRDAFGKDDVDRVIVERPGARKVVYNKGNGGALYGTERKEFMGAATKCYNDVRTAILANKRGEIQDIVAKFNAIGEANHSEGYKSTSMPSSRPSK